MLRSLHAACGAGAFCVLATALQPGRCIYRRGVGIAAAAKGTYGSASQRQPPPPLTPAAATPPHRKQRSSAS